MTESPVQQRRFDGKVALVTGAGSGIGRAVALRLAVEGARVFAVDVDEVRLHDTAAAAADVVRTHVADLADPQACKDAVEACVATLGRLDVIGNIAGISRAEHFTDVTVEQYRQMMAVNVDAYFFLAQAAIPHLLETGGNIVNIASNAGLMGQAYTVVYCMSKAAVALFTRSLAMEYVKTPLRVNAIAPGGTNTALVQNFQMPPDVDFALMQPYVAFRPAAEPQEIATLFAYVASDEARSVHGSILSIDNGLTAS
jgi:meso-butanediol dehydrogenase / (S,S)-butanediol dehydrogenase / diacetyl reductase